ncbi:zinc metalloprotease HtpX [Candidatus Roizmanbacteria bacterium RIFCSPHIGHO2_01_FULL_39_12c]|uniref:Protease HtpX homolog n=1 Tax=Candidatus Roizmanbacteria bacterium RIFCSPHIGHO2_01_FULL_39_12c TaxID=1802031 RepID=A0A1F7GER1_9BACT|nr:MAG: zinc metalloprotease HtpX [Candidatus Roizmanbacteria bacterium RIFCSPHIGHO2_01_FULL_39_12c]OGK48088.1 MAG: zinc metalloprotease HtpX [Candidatus Roizmanbacteria bacterium RIFCSPLOWO2_01_FULL_40_13]
MTVYQQIANNKARTYAIILTFILLVTGFFLLIGNYIQSPTAYLIIGLSFSLFSTIGSYFYSDRIVLFTTGARLAKKEEFFDFYTVIENLSIAAGLPMPKLYVIDDPAPNAFATGRDPKHAVVAATTGLLEKLERTELEGVLAHELSHIRNLDILVSSIVAVLVGTVALLSDWIMRNLWWSGLRKSEDRNNRNPFMMIFIILVLILTPIIATLIQLAVSRRREFLADASGALLTRYPEGLARALEKISTDGNVLRNASSSTAHLFIMNPFKKVKKASSIFTSLFSTHPPLEERIKILRSM